MLTGYQMETAAYMTEHGELLCPDCFDRGDTYAKPVSRYALDEWQSGTDSHDHYDEDPESHVEDCACEDAVYCEGGPHTGWEVGELVEAYVDPDCAEKRGE